MKKCLKCDVITNNINEITFDTEYVECYQNAIGDSYTFYIECIEKDIENIISEIFKNAKIENLSICDFIEKKFLISWIEKETETEMEKEICGIDEEHAFCRLTERMNDVDMDCIEINAI
jgi:hypothetical protein